MNDGFDMQAAEHTLMMYIANSVKLPEAMLKGSNVGVRSLA